MVQDLRGGDPKALAQVVRGLVVAANEDPQLSRVFTTFLLRVIRPSTSISTGTKSRFFGSAGLGAVFQALQASLGGYFVNNMNLFGRTWKVQVQAEAAADRATIEDIYRINVRDADGKIIPLRSLVEARPIVGPPALIRYNDRQAVTVQGSPASGVSSGQALKAMEASRARTLPRSLHRQLDRYRVPGRKDRRQNCHHPRLCRFVRLPLSRRTLRKLEHPDLSTFVGNRCGSRLISLPSSSQD